MPMIETVLGPLNFVAYDMEGATWNDCPGVYLFVQQGLGGALILYVGQCSSFQARMCGHDRWAEAQRRGATEVHAAAIPSAIDRDRVEAQLIGRFQPAMNAQLRAPTLCWAQR